MLVYSKYWCVMAYVSLEDIETAMVAVKRGGVRRDVGRVRE